MSERTGMHIFDPEGPLLTINDDHGEPMVTIERDRSLTFGEGYEPDDAARRFWEAMARHAPVVA